MTTSYPVNELLMGSALISADGAIALMIVARSGVRRSKSIFSARVASAPTAALAVPPPPIIATRATA